MAKYTPKTRDELKELVKDSSIYLGDIDTSNITNMATLFFKSARRDFSGVESWDTSNVTDMSGMFGNASYFNHNINSWDTSKVTNMTYMFYGATSFNQPLDSWDTSKVVDMTCMFFRAKSFNKPLNSWDTYNVVSMYYMFCAADKFNQPLDNWDTSGVEIMTDMFLNAVSFKQNLNSWDISSVRDNQEVFAGSGMRRMPKWYKNMQFFSDLNNANDINGEIERLVTEAIANPRPKKPKIAPQDRLQNNTNDWSNIFGGSSQPALTKKSLFRIIGATLFFVILAVVAINFDDMRRSIKRSNSKATTQTTQQKQTQSAQQPAKAMPRCDDSSLLETIIKSHKNRLINGYNDDIDGFTEWQEGYRKHGINITSVEEFVNSFKYNIANVRTKSSDEVNRQIDCEVEIEQVFPVPQNNPLKVYFVTDYRERITDNNKDEVYIFETREILDK